MPNVIQDLELSAAEVVSVVDKGASGNSAVRPAIVLVKRKKETHQMTEQDIQSIIKAARQLQKQDGEGMKTPEQMLAETLETEITDEALRDKLMALIAAVAGTLPAPEAPAPEATEETKAEGDPEEPAAEDEDEMAKRMASDPLIKKMATDLAKAQKTADAAVEIAAAEVLKRRKAEKVDFAKSLAYISGTSDELAADLIAAEDSLDPEAYVRLEKRLISANEVIKSSELLRPNGAPGAVVAGSAASEYEAGVETIQKSARESGKNLSRAQAVRRINKSNPELAKRYRAEIAGN